MRFKDRKNLTVELIDEFNKIIYHLSYFFSFQLSAVSTMFLTPRLAVFFFYFIHSSNTTTKG